MSAGGRGGEREVPGINRKLKKKNIYPQMTRMDTAFYKKDTVWWRDGNGLFCIKLYKV